jgi:hypothetical protein
MMATRIMETAVLAHARFNPCLHALVSQARVTLLPPSMECLLVRKSRHRPATSSPLNFNSPLFSYCKAILISLGLLPLLPKIPPSYTAKSHPAIQTESSVLPMHLIKIYRD